MTLKSDEESHYSQLFIFKTTMNLTYTRSEEDLMEEDSCILLKITDSVSEYNVEQSNQQFSIPLLHPIRNPHYTPFKRIHTC